MNLSTCPNRDQAFAEAAAKPGDRDAIRPVSQPVRAPAALTACQCHRCAERGAHRISTAEELDAYIAQLVERAPPLTSEQRDKLALLLHDHRSSGITRMRMVA